MFAVKITFEVPEDFKLQNSPVRLYDILFKLHQLSKSNTDSFPIYSCVHYVHKRGLVIRQEKCFL